MLKHHLLKIFACLLFSTALVACGDPADGDDNNEAQTCETTADCGEGQGCTVDGVCKPLEGEACTGDLDCESDYYCGEGVCRPNGCTTDEQCIGGSICDNGSFCRSGCREDTDCDQAAGERCSQVSFICVEDQGCSPNECGDFQVCDTAQTPSACKYTGNCANDRDCTAYTRQEGIDEEYICDTEAGSCIPKPPCESDDQCEFGEICLEGECQAGCRQESENACPAGQYCSDDLKCIQGCTSNGDCETGQACVNLECRTTCGTRDACETGEICTGDPQICQECSSNDDCYASEFCNFEAEGTADGRGLCKQLPPECPPDGYDRDTSTECTLDNADSVCAEGQVCDEGFCATPYGNNHSQVSAFTIDSFPFEQTAEASPLFCRQNSGEWFKLTADPGKVVDVQINYDDTAGNLDIGLLRSNGTEVAKSARPPSGESGFERLQYGVDADRADPMELFIHVRGTLVDAKVAYDLTVDVRDPMACADDGYEPNNTPEEAVVLPAATPETLEVCGDDPDYFQLAVQDRQLVTITVEAPARLGDVDIFLYKEGASTIIANSATTNDKETINYRTEEAGNLILEVVTKGGSADQDGLPGKAEYTIEWDTEDDPCADDLEGSDGNNTCSTAEELTEGTYSNLKICDDNDYYTVELRPLDRVTVTATYDPATAAGELQLTLFGPNACGNFLSSAAEEEVQGSTEKQLIIRDPQDASQGFQAQLGGTYYILASRFSGIQVPYSLDIQVDQGPPCQDDSYDTSGGNDDYTTATAIDATKVPNNGEDSALLGLQVCDYNQDWYEITVADGQSLEWELVFDAAQGELGAAIVDSDGSTELATLGTDNKVSVTNSSGADKTYYLRVNGANGLPVRNDYWVLTYIDGSGPADATCPDVYENNDSSTAAQELSAGTYGNLLVCGGDADWYRTMVEAGETITVSASFTHTDGNIDLHLYEDSDLSRAVKRSSTSADTETVTYTSARDQYVYYQVNTNTSVEGNDYQLDVSIDAASPCSDDGFEPNNDPSTATAVEAPGLYSRLQKCEDQSDWYAVELNNGELFEAYLNYESNRADLDVEIYTVDDTTTPVASGDDAAQYTPTSSGTHYVKVFAPNRARLGYDLLLYRDLDGSGSFEAGEGPEDRLCPDAYEDNDSLSEAAEVPAGSYTDLLLCSGTPINDSDYYQIYVPGGATVTVDLSFTHSDGNIDAVLYSPSNLIVDSSRTSTDSESVSATNNGNVGANYTVQVTGGIGSFQNYYDMDVGLAFGSTCSDDAYPTNGDSTTAAALSAGAYDLNLCEGTEDWFELTVADSETIEANVELRNRLGNIDIELYDSSNNVQVASTTDANIESINYTVATGGTYYLRVFPRDGAFMRNAYDLWLSVGGTTPAAPYCPDDYERNDETDAAYSFDFNTSPQLADPVMCSIEEDWYKVDLFGTPTYELKTFFDHSADFDLAIEVRDASGNVLQDAGGNDISFANNTSTNDELASFSPPATGTYFIGVKQMGSDVSVQGDYYMYFDSASASCPEDSGESNNSPAQASLLTEGVHALASCPGSNTAQDDYWKFEPATDGTLTIDVYYDDATLELSGAFDSFSPNMTASKNRLTYSTSVTGGSTYIMYLGNVSGSGPYFIDVQYN